MDFIIEFIKDWGYLAVFLGALVEGESIILTASALAYAGFLNIYIVAVVAFFSTIFAEQTCYLIGRHYGPGLFDRLPRLKPAANKAFSILKRIDVWFILTCRFIYGIRTVSPLVIGAAQIPIKKFIPLNILAAAIWASISCAGGYYLGEVIMSNADIIKQLSKNVGLLVLAIFIVVGSIIIFIKYRKKIHKNI
ncbi:MAG TPA: hypothetical protein DIC42_00100 [Holosporales bacterium]|nr:hypothetical protein [Holosporales bacterium]